MSNEKGAKYRTGFIESDLILAVQAGDWDEAERLVNELTPYERRKLRRAANEMQILLYKTKDE